MKQIVNALLAAAASRAQQALRKQAQAATPPAVDHRLNAGGWN
jgi:hypothetical protein